MPIEFPYFTYPYSDHRQAFSDTTVTFSDESADQSVIELFSVPNPWEYECTFSISPRVKTVFMKIVYGWSCKGPVRKKLFLKVAKRWGLQIAALKAKESLDRIKKERM